LKLYEIRDRLLSSGRLVYSLDQLAVLLGVPESHAKVYASRLVAKRWAWRPRRGFISLTRDDFVLATQLVEPSYVSMHAALHLRGLLDQVPSTVECVTTRYSLRLRDLGIVYRRVKPSLFFGYERVERAGSYVFVATPEKALLDAVYFGYSLPDCGFADLETLKRLARVYASQPGPRARRVAAWVRLVARKGGCA